MHPFWWFALVLGFAVAYGVRMRSTIGRVETPLASWHIAATLAAGLGVGSVLAIRFGLSIEPDVGIALHAVVLYACVRLGLRHWFGGRSWELFSTIASFAFVGLYFTSPHRWNNAMLTMVSLGVSVGGYYVTKRWLRVFFVLMACFDAYAVWGSNLMERLIAAPQGVFPGQLVIGQFSLPFLEIGALDVTLGALGVVGVLRHRGVARSVYFAVSCCLSGLGIAFAASQGIQLATAIPFLVVLAPLVLLFLAFRGPTVGALSVC